jgi:hypothetical protein
MSREASQFFASLFIEDSQDGLAEDNQFLSCIPSLVIEEMNEHLLGHISLEELEATLFQMKKGKAPIFMAFQLNFIKKIGISLSWIYWRWFVSLRGISRCCEL